MTGAELAESRRELNLSQERLAELLGIEESELRSWEDALMAGGDYPRLLELAMAQVEYEATAMPDDEFRALQNRIEERLVSSEALLAESNGRRKQ
jgi:transcriptional regulator with XRE-family HTH domain